MRFWVKVYAAILQAYYYNVLTSVPFSPISSAPLREMNNLPKATQLVSSGLLPPQGWPCPLLCNQKALGELGLPSPQAHPWASHYTALSALAMLFISPSDIYVLPCL